REWLLHKRIFFDLQTATAGLRITFELRLQPVGGGERTGPSRKVAFCTGNRAAVLERNQRLDVGFDLLRRNLTQRSSDLFVDWQYGNGSAGDRIIMAGSSTRELLGCRKGGATY